MEKRNTKQKEIILDAVKTCYTHPTAEVVYNKIKNENPKISLSTVYRNLQDMAALGIIRKFSDENNVSHFDGNNEQHYHFICDNCHEIEDLDLSYKENLDRKLGKNYIDLRHEIVFRGLCKNCKDNHLYNK